MATNQIDILFPVGRMVGGNVYELKQYTPEPGKEPKPPMCSIGVAIPKVPGQHWALSDWGSKIWNAGHARDPQAGQMRDFAWKIVDGDDTELNKNKKRPCDQPGYPGHWVLWFSQTWLPKLCYISPTNQVIEQSPTTEVDIQPGYFVQMYGSVKPNTGPTPGVYLNPIAVCRVAFGERIMSGPDVSAVGFGQGVQLPSGATQTPPAAPTSFGQTPPSPPAPTGQALAPLPVAPPPVAPAPVPVMPAPVAPAAVPVMPAPGFLAPTANVPVPVPPAAPVPTTPQLTAAALAQHPGSTYQSFIQGGWSDALLRQHGFIV